MTAVQFLEDKLSQVLDWDLLELFEQAKAKEKEQIEDAFISGGYAGLHFPLTKDAFYKEYLENKFTEYHKTNYTNGL